MHGFVVAFDGRTGSQAFRAKRMTGLLNALEMFYLAKGSIEPHPDVTDWRVFNLANGRDATLQLIREREAAVGQRAAPGATPTSDQAPAGTEAPAEPALV